MDDRRTNLDDRLAGITAAPAVPVADRVERAGRYAGLRLTADEYERLDDDGCRYELLDGVVVMSPSPIYGHNRVAGEIERQILNYLDEHPVGEVVRETDVTLDPLRVYRPDLMYLSRERFPEPTDRVHAVPDMIVEVLSPATRAMDLNTKRDDYQRFGVTEYWIVDPEGSGSAAFTFLRLAPEKRKGSAAHTRMAYQPVPCKGSRFPSKAVAGFTLDLTAIKRLMKKRK